MSAILSAAERLLERLDGVLAAGADQWSAKCPAHDDRTPSLRVSAAQERVLVYCNAGCTATEVVAAIGLTESDLFGEGVGDASLAPGPVETLRIQFRFERSSSSASEGRLSATLHEGDLVTLDLVGIHPTADASRLRYRIMTVAAETILDWSEMPFASFTVPRQPSLRLFIYVADQDDTASSTHQTISLQIKVRPRRN